MRAHDRKIVISIFLVVVVAMLLVALSLPTMNLQPGTPFPSGDGQDEAPSPSDGESRAPSREYSNSLLKGILALVFLVSFFFVFANFITRLKLKTLLRGAIALLLLLVLLKLIPSTPIAQPGPVTIDPASLDIVQAPSVAVSPLEEPPQAWRWIVVGILIAAALIIAFWFFIRRTGLKPTQDGILHEAEDAANAIRRGEDLKSVILRCYQQMSRILREERGIERDESMTAREFMELLRDRGVSPSPVRQLTLLFEAARYGAFHPGEKEEQISLDCLDQIVRDCQQGEE